MSVLFVDVEGKAYDEEKIRQVLMAIGAADCETLFIHSDVLFGMPGEGFRRKEYLRILYEIVASLGVSNIVVPTFTYSFCNNEDFNVLKSKTSMGAFNEYVRNLDGRYRTHDPLLSLSVPIKLKPFFKQYEGIHSLGEYSGMDAIHHMDGVKFLFLGAEMADSFTYVHYVEKMLEVPYRFDMPFDGNIVFENGIKEKRRQYIHTQCYGVKLPPKYDYFENEMVERGYVRKARLGNKYVACLAEKDAYEQIVNKIKMNKNYFLAEPFEEADLIHRYTYAIRNGRITHC